MDSKLYICWEYSADIVGFSKKCLFSSIFNVFFLLGDVLATALHGCGKTPPLWCSSKESEFANCVCIIEHIDIYIIA